MQAYFFETPYFAALLVLYFLLAMFLAQVVLQPFRTQPGNDTAFYCGICILMTMIGGMAGVALKDQGSDRDQQNTVNGLTILAVAAGAVLICRNAGKELYLNAMEEVKARMTSTVKTVPIFEDCDDAFVGLVSTKLISERHSKGHVFASIGDLGDSMWIITGKQDVRWLLPVRPVLFCNICLSYSS